MAQVTYYDPKAKALIKITRKGKPSKAKKKMYRKNRLSQLGQLQQNMMADIVFTRGMSSKDPDKAPIDQRERILAAREQEKLMNANLLALTAAVKALTMERTDTSGKAEKDFIEIATKNDLLTTEDILMSDRDAIGAEVFDKAVINSTKKARLMKLGQDDPTLNIFNDTGDGRVNSTKLKRLFGYDFTSSSIDLIYKTFTSSGKFSDVLSKYKYIRSEESGATSSGGGDISEDYVPFKPSVSLRRVRSSPSPSPGRFAAEEEEARKKYQESSDAYRRRQPKSDEDKERAREISRQRSKERQRSLSRSRASPAPSRDVSPERTKESRSSFS